MNVRFPNENAAESSVPLLYNSNVQIDTDPVQIDTVPEVKEQCIDVLCAGFRHKARQEIQRNVANNMVILIQRKNLRTAKTEVASCMTLAAQEDRGNQIVLIDLIATHRGHGRSGHAKSLFNAINGYSCFNGRTQVLHVRAQDKAARGLCRSLGFIEQSGHNKIYANGDIQLEYRREVAHNKTGAPLLYNNTVQIDTVPEVKEQCINVLRVGFPHIARQEIQRDVAKNMVMLIQCKNPRTEQIEVASCMTLAAKEDRGKQIVLINLIATHRDHGGKGHAKSLLNAINVHSCFEGKTQVLHVRAQNEAAKGLYRSLGFIEQAGHNKTYANGDIQLEYRREVAHN